LPGRIGELRTLVANSTTPPDVPTEVQLYCFASQLRSLQLETRPTLATPDVFRLVTDILALVPAPALVDAICTTVDAALRQQERLNSTGGIIVPEQVNTAYVARVCTPALAKALCALVALGRDYASRAVFAALRYFVNSTEFKSLSTLASAMLVHLSVADESGVVRRVAQELRTQHLFADYSTLPFPKPDLPLTRDSLLSLSPVASPSSSAGFFVTDPASFAVDGTTITRLVGGTETVVVLAPLDRVCALSLSLSISLSPTPQGKWKLSVLLSSLLLLSLSQSRPDPPAPWETLFVIHSVFTSSISHNLIHRHRLRSRQIRRAQRTMHWI
jgi:hypothetical protein